MNILVLTPFAEKDWVWLSKYFPEHQWTIINNDLFGKKHPSWLIKALYSVKNVADYDIVISHHPYMTFFIALALTLTLKNKKTKHYAFSFNHGNGRFFKGLMLKIAKIIFKSTSGFVVYSETERDIFNKRYDIPFDKLSFCHWAVNQPEVEEYPQDYITDAKPYICCMGRNNRDFETFLEVMEKNQNIKAIIVCPKERISRNNIPENVIIKNNISLKESMTILANSYASVVPLQDASTGAGHITIVSAMQLGIPQLITKVDTVNDYFIDQKHGFYITPNDAQSLSDCLNKLTENKTLQKTISQESIAFANKWLIEESSVSFLKNYLSAIESNMPIPKFPESWPGSSIF